MGTFTLLLAALGTAQAAGPEQATAFGCQTEFMTNTIVEGITKDQICGAVIQFGRCVANVVANTDSRSEVVAIESQRDQIVATYQCDPDSSVAPPTMHTNDNHLTMSVDHDKDVKFYRFRREETSVWEMKGTMDKMVVDLADLANVRTDVMGVVDENLKVAAAAAAAASTALKAAVEATTNGLGAEVEDSLGRITDIEDALKATCASSEFMTSNGCKTLAVCTNDQYEHTPPAEKSDRVCKSISTACASDEFEKLAPTRIANRLCYKQSVCSSSEYELLPPTKFTNRLCAARSNTCPNGFVKGAAATAISNIVCTPWTVCKSDEYEAVKGSSTEDRYCRNKGLRGVSPRPWYHVTTGNAPFKGEPSQVKFYAVQVKEDSGTVRYRRQDYQEICRKKGMQTWRDENNNCVGNWKGNSGDNDGTIFGGECTRGNHCNLGGHDVMSEFYQSFKNSPCYESRGQSCDGHCGGPLLTREEYAADLKVMGMKPNKSYRMANKKYHSSDYDNDASWMQFNLAADHKTVTYQSRTQGGTDYAIAICACRECPADAPCNQFGCCPREKEGCIGIKN